MRIAAAGILLASISFIASGSDRPATSLPSDTPAEFKRVTTSFDYDKREVMIPMRDGVKLKTFILVPKGAKGAPIALTRTPYNAGNRVERFNSPHFASVVPQFLDTAAEAGYIVVFQDVRGKYGSEGDYVMARPLIGPLNPTDNDHATDTYDTIDWLVKNVPESNGRVGILGGSYEAFTVLMALVNPHPALKVAVPFAALVDGWLGDDWFHNGAYRQMNMNYLYDQVATRKSGEKWWTGTYDQYEEYLATGSAGDMAASRGLEQIGAWKSVLAHPAYDEYWQQQALDKYFAEKPPTIPVMIIHGLFDQEDTYGSPALFDALAPHDPKGEKFHLVMGPWNHSQTRREGRKLGPFEFAGDTSTWVRRTVMQPFLDHYLKDAPRPDTPRVLAYETGADEWRRYDAWPRACAKGCAQPSQSLYLQPGGKLGFEPPKSGEAYAEYVSDPAKPVPYTDRPILPTYAEGSNWGEWLMSDQRNAASRPDVVVFQTEPLKAPIRVAGLPLAKLVASTSGTDSDWVVKLIDVWPSEVPEKAKLGGYQQMISGDIFRGRYREDFAVARPLPSNKAVEYTIRLPTVSHTFLPGHRIMVQVQSSWFPLYDRNPQKFIPNILLAKPGDYQKATQRVWHAPGKASAIELPVVPVDVR